MEMSESGGVTGRRPTEKQTKLICPLAGEVKWPVSERKQQKSTTAQFFQFLTSWHDYALAHKLQNLLA